MLISFEECTKLANTTFQGVIHIGAHLGEECEAYRNAQVKNIIWIEANSNLIKDLKNRTQFVCSSIPQQYFCYLMGKTTDEEKNFYITNNGESSSMLPLGTHETHYPHIIVTKIQKLKTIKFVDLVKKESIDFSKFDFINLDIQGAELEVLKGFGELLNSSTLKAIYCEVNFEELYVGAALFKELSEFLESFKFKPITIAKTPQNWGDCLFLKQS